MRLLPQGIELQIPLRETVEVRPEPEFVEPAVEMTEAE
jgi:hypothetical protein